MLEINRSNQKANSLSIGRQHASCEFFETQAELANLANLPNLPNSVKIKNPLNVSKFKIKNFISF